MTVMLESVFVCLCSYSEVRADQSVRSQDVDDQTQWQDLHKHSDSLTFHVFCVPKHVLLVQNM